MFRPEPSTDRFGNEEFDYPSWCDIERRWWGTEDKEAEEEQEREYEAEMLGFDSVDDMDDCFAHTPCSNGPDYYSYISYEEHDRNAECQPY